MRIKDIFKIFNKKHVENLLIEHGAEMVQETFEQIDGEEAYDEATKTAIDFIKKHPDLATKILENINENISPTVAVNTVMQLPEKDVVSEDTMVKAIKKLDLKDEKKIEIIEEGGFGYKNKIEIAEQLEDEETRENMYQALYEEEEQRALIKLEKVYKMCNEEMNEVMLGQQLDKALEDIHIDSEAIREKRNRIVARKIAYNYATIGTTIVSKLRFVMSPKEMAQINIAQLVKEEHKILLKERENIKGRKIKPFNEEKIEELNKKIDIELESTANMYDDDKEYSEEIAFKELRRNMRQFGYNFRKSLIQMFNNIVQNANMMKSFESLYKSGIIQRLAELPEDERKKAIEIYGDALEKRINVKKEYSTDNSDISGTPSEGR